MSRDLLKSNDWWTSNEEEMMKSSKIEESTEKPNIQDTTKGTA